MKSQIEQLKEIVEHQADMQSLWLMYPSINEAMLIAALRHLHAVIDGDNAMAEFSKHAYWNLENDV